MSLLTVNHKVLYLILLICLLLGLTSANQNITIYVQEDGINESECMEGNESIPCRTLSYILNQINNRSNDTFNGTNISVYVYITYSQEITNLSHIRLLVNLYLIGVDNPVLKFSGSRNVFSFNSTGSFYAENITFYKISGNYSLITVSFNKCIFTSGGSAVTNMISLYIIVRYVIISNCLFHNNVAQSELIYIESVLIGNISGCDFYQNKGQKALVVIHSSGKPRYIFEIANCSIYDNEVSEKIFRVFSYKPESLVIVTNCLFSNNTSDQYFFLTFIDRVYMSNVNVISNKIKWIRASIIHMKSPFPNGNEHSNMSNIMFINNTGTGLELEYVTVYISNITFYNNCGVNGGGMSLLHTRIYLTGSLIFKRNKAVNGGAIYIAAMEEFAIMGYCTTLEQITFSNNYASTLGTDVFIQSGGLINLIVFHAFPCIDNNKTNHVRGDHIISGPYNITINPQSHSSITLFPGQKLTYSAKVTDYFGNLTSCLVNVFLQCGVNLIFCEYAQLTGDAESLISTI